MVKKWIFLLILNSTVIFIAGGCGISSNTSYVYKGENQNWYAEYSIRFDADNYKGTAKRNLKLSYKNDISELNKVKHLEYSYESSVARKKAILEFEQPPNKKVYTLNSSGNGAMENKDEIIKVLIVIDDKTELIELKFNEDAQFDYMESNM